ncbi:MAG: hypothetical protein Q9219_005906 [cf. Caloplaca sp. 3 TL-2023]
MELPECTSCTSRDANTHKHRPPASLTGASPAKPPQHHATPKKPPTLPSFPAHYFLDLASFQYRQGQIPLISIPLPRELVESCKDPQSIARSYFETIHPFLPFISKKNFYDHFPPVHVQPNIVFTILVSCMKLISWLPPKNAQGNDPKSPTYLAIKRTLTETDVAGIFSLQLLQATILVSMYEVGHAMYPAAYTSIGACARYALALGIDAFMVVDLTPTALPLFVNLGYPKRPLTTPDPAPEVLLPIDDATFDRGSITLEQLYTILAPAESIVGSFAKLAQAAYLLGRVLRHICDLTAERNLHQDEGMQLSTRLQALLKVVENENQISSASALCSSALMTLHDPNAARIDPIHLDFAKQLVKPVVEDLSQSIKDFLIGNIDHQAHPSPLLSQWIYQAATVVGRLNAQTGDGLGKFENIALRLECLNHRWLVAGTYLRILTGS